MTDASVNDAMSACAKLRTVAVQQADPNRFADLPVSLLGPMRASAIGLRMLARALAQGPAPVLFGEPVWDVPDNAEWLYWPKAALDALAFDLAALALGGPIRATVKREAVLRLRRVLGNARYLLALNETRQRADADGFADALRIDDALERYLRVRGYAELIGYAGSLHPACAERIRIVLPPAECSAVDPCLSATRVAEHLERIRAIGTSMNDSAPRMANG